MPSARVMLAPCEAHVCLDTLRSARNSPFLAKNKNPIYEITSSANAAVEQICGKKTREYPASPGKEPVPFFKNRAIPRSFLESAQRILLRLLLSRHFSASLLPSKPAWRILEKGLSLVREAAMDAVFGIHGPR